MTFWVAGAVVVGAGINAYSANKGTKAQRQSLSESTAETARQYDQTRADQLALLEQQRADQQPWLEAGKASLAQLASGMQPGGQFARGFTLADYAADPGYQFRQSEGERSIERMAAARGGRYSGATLKALARFNSDLASQEYGNAYTRFGNDRNTQVSRLQSLAGLGQSATNVIGQAGQSAYGTIAQAGQNASNTIANNMTNAGNARASGYVGMANAVSGGIGQYLNYTQNQDLLRTLQSRRPKGDWTGYDFADTRIRNTA